MLLLLSVVQLCAEPNGGRYLEAKKEADGRFVTKTSGSLSVAGLFAGLKERFNYYVAGSEKWLRFFSGERLLPRPE
jgi:hypothetical protein